MEVTLGHVTNATHCDHFMNIPTYLGLIKILLDYLNGFVDVKVID